MLSDFTALLLSAVLAGQAQDFAHALLSIQCLIIHPNVKRLLLCLITSSGCFCLFVTRRTCNLPALCQEIQVPLVTLEENLKVFTWIVNDRSTVKFIPALHC